MKLITEFDSGETKLHEVARLERAETFIQPASLGISIEESKQIAVAIQAHMVSDQVDRHNKALTACRFCGARLRTNGYYMSIFKPVFGKVPMRVRRVWGCECCGVGKRTFSSLALFYSLGAVVPGLATGAGNMFSSEIVGVTGLEGTF